EFGGVASSAAPAAAISASAVLTFSSAVVTSSWAVLVASSAAITASTSLSSSHGGQGFCGVASPGPAGVVPGVAPPPEPPAGLPLGPFPPVGGFGPAGVTAGGVAPPPTSFFSTGFTGFGTTGFTGDGIAVVRVLQSMTFTQTRMWTVGPPLVGTTSASTKSPPTCLQKIRMLLPNGTPVAAGVASLGFLISMDTSWSADWNT